MKRAAKDENANPFAKGIPRSFEELVGVWTPRAIHDHVEFENASEIMNALAGHDLNKDQADYLETVAILVDENDRAHNKQLANASPRAVLEYLLEEHDISGRELGRVLGSEAVGGFILRGERSITVEQARKLGKHFSVDPSLFLDL
jgi:HTH-type transcriptional regulator/antitoxin HigA